LLILEILSASSFTNRDGRQTVQFKTMWTCPKCKHKFYNKNQSHSCGSYTVDNFLKGKTEKAIDLFNCFLAEYKKIGDFELHPVKTRVALLTKMRFCAINKLGKDFMDVHFVFTKPYNDNSCFLRIDNLADRFFIHHLKVYDKADINSEVKKYMKLAYDIGNRKHIEGKKKKI
jgi:hypothetical protein